MYDDVAQHHASEWSRFRLEHVVFLKKHDISIASTCGVVGLMNPEETGAYEATSHQLSEQLIDVVFVAPDADETHVVPVAREVRGRLGIQEFQVKRQPESCGIRIGAIDSSSHMIRLARHGRTIKMHARGNFREIAT